MGYKPTKVGGKIKYLPNSAAIKKFKDQGSYNRKLPYECT